MNLETFPSHSIILNYSKVARRFPARILWSANASLATVWINHKLHVSLMQSSIICVSRTAFTGRRGSAPYFADIQLLAIFLCIWIRLFLLTRSTPWYMKCIIQRSVTFKRIALCDLPLYYQKSSGMIEICCNISHDQHARGSPLYSDNFLCT